MAQRLVKVKYCDRCPINKPKPATHSRIFGFDDTQWKIDLCDTHDDMLTRDLFGWGLMAESVEVESQQRFGAAYAADMRRVSEIRDREAAAAREAARVKPLDVQPPLGHEDWEFSEHALERMDERFIDPVQVLWAATKPQVKRPGRDRGLLVQERDDIRVVINPDTKTIVTTAVVDSTRKAVGL